MGIRFVKILPDMYKLDVKGLCEMSILCLSASFGESGLVMSNNQLAQLMNSSRSGIIHAINRLTEQKLITIERPSYGQRVIKANGDSIRLYEEDKKKKQNGATVALSGDTCTPLADGDTFGQNGDTCTQNGLKVAQNGVLSIPITKVTKRTDSNISGLLPGIEPPTKPPRKKIPLPYPTWDEWLSYCKSIDWDDELDCSSAFNHYVACGWVQGKNKSKIVDWHGAARGCRDRNEKRRRERTTA